MTEFQKGLSFAPHLIFIFTLRSSVYIKYRTHTNSHVSFARVTKVGNLAAGPRLQYFSRVAQRRQRCNFEPFCESIYHQKSVRRFSVYLVGYASHQEKPQNPALKKSSAAFLNSRGHSLRWWEMTFQKYDPNMIMSDKGTHAECGFVACWKTRLDVWRVKTMLI